MISLLIGILALMMVIGLVIVLGIIFLALGPIGIILMLVAPFIAIDVAIVKAIKRKHSKDPDPKRE